MENSQETPIPLNQFRSEVGPDPDVKYRLLLSIENEEIGRRRVLYLNSRIGGFESKPNASEKLQADMLENVNQLLENGYLKYEGEWKTVGSENITNDYDRYEDDPNRFALEQTFKQLNMQGEIVAPEFSNDFSLPERRSLLNTLLACDTEHAKFIKTKVQLVLEDKNPELFNKLNSGKLLETLTGIKKEVEFTDEEAYIIKNTEDYVRTQLYGEAAAKFLKSYKRARNSIIEEFNEAHKIKDPKDKVVAINILKDKVLASMEDVFPEDQVTSTSFTELKGVVPKNGNKIIINTRMELSADGKKTRVVHEAVSYDDKQKDDAVVDGVVSEPTIYKSKIQRINQTQAFFNDLRKINRVGSDKHLLGKLVNYQRSMYGVTIDDEV